jgi:hypothetical protein
MLENLLIIIYVTIWTIILLYIPILLGKVEEIKENWEDYRCSPMVLPISGYINKDENLTASEATSQNFAYCTQNIASSYMSVLTQPYNFILDSLAGLGGNLSENIESIRGAFNKIKEFFIEIINKIYSVFINVILEFVKIVIMLKDLVSKIVGIGTIIGNILQGVSLTVGATWAGTPGQTIRFLCFHPNTILRKKDNSICKISELNLGDILEGNSEVLIILKIKNNDNNKLYKLPNTINNKYIYVSGSHLIQHNNKYILVKDHPESIESNMKTNELYCLVTSNNIIKIGNYIFYDWEDDVERFNLYNKNNHKI